ncbi:MAG: helix-turn-helix transcriptional regulator [Chlorobi bacterium]|nr:helix-turn-helix transcriptional regulator [Chlorobiota bacterium]
MENTIRVERAKKRITQAELAKQVHVSRQTIHAIENNKFVPSTLLALKIARYFGISVEDLFILERSDLED